MRAVIQGVAMTLQSRPELAFCIAGDRAVFLDVAADRYFCLSSPLNRALLDIAEGREGSLGLEAAALISLGILNEADGRCAAHPTTIAQATEEPAPTRASYHLLAAAVQAIMRVRIRRWPFAKIVAHERARQPAPIQRRQRLDLAALHAAFLTVSTWYGDADQCLARTLAFRMIASRYGYAPAMVIGVKLDPFGAHCWAQTGARVDNDSVERVRLFTPILVV